MHEKVALRVTQSFISFLFFKKKGLNTIHPLKVVPLFQFGLQCLKFAMCPNKVSQFVNVANPLVFSVCSEGKGITCIGLASSFFSHLDAVNYRIDLEKLQTPHLVIHQKDHQTT
jgi:hypothetical protein